jgi:hypothetical protein
MKWVGDCNLFGVVNCVWNVMSHVQKPDFVYQRKRRVHLNRRGRQFSRLLAAELCASAVVMVIMLDAPCSEIVWRILATHSIRHFPLHFPSRASPCAVTFQLDSTSSKWSCSQFYPVHTFLYTCRFSSTNATKFLFGKHFLLSLQTTYPLCHSQPYFHHVFNRCLFWSHIKTLLHYNTHS